MYVILSGRRELNPDYMTPSHAYYHYTTARSEERRERAVLMSSERTG